MSAETLLDLTVEDETQESEKNHDGELHRCCAGCWEDTGRWIAFCGSDRTGRPLMPIGWDAAAQPHCAGCDAEDVLVDLTGICPAGKHRIVD